MEPQNNAPTGNDHGNKRPRSSASVVSMNFVQTVMQDASALRLENAVLQFEGAKLVDQLEERDAEINRLRTEMVVI